MMIMMVVAVVLGGGCETSYSIPHYHESEQEAWISRVQNKVSSVLIYAYVDSHVLSCLVFVYCRQDIIEE